VIKFDLMRLGGRFLPLELRESIHAALARTIPQALASGRPVDPPFNLPVGDKLPGGAVLERRLNYRFRRS